MQIISLSCNCVISSITLEESEINLHKIWVNFLKMIVIPSLKSPLLIWRY